MQNCRGAARKMQKGVTLLLDDVGMNRSSGYITMANCSPPKPTNRGIEDVKFTSFPEQVHQSQASPKLAAVPSKEVTTSSIHTIVEPIPTSHSPTAPERAQQFSIGKKKCIVVTVVLVCLLILILAGSFILLGKYLAAKKKADSIENKGHFSSIDPLADTEDADWVTSPHAAITTKATHTPSTPSAEDRTTTEPLTACQTARNLTEYWRMEHQGANIKLGTGPHAREGYACDLYTGFGWFRFTGAAGSRLLNACPPLQSCGGFYAFWSDSQMPQVTGVIHHIFIYSRRNNDPENVECRELSMVAEVVRCSWDSDYDFVYRVLDANLEGCVATLCGMS